MLVVRFNIAGIQGTWVLEHCEQNDVPRVSPQNTVG